MQLVSVLGLVVILGLAWALSYHRREVRLRPVAWGLSLQLLFAVIVLRQDALSFTGMVVLAALLAAYLLRRWPGVEPRPWAAVAVLAVAAAGGAAVLALLDASATLWGVAVALALLLANGRAQVAPRAQPLLAVVLVACGVAALVAHGWHGQRIFAAFSDQVSKFLNLSDYGARFLFGNLADPAHYFTGEGAAWPGFGFQFAFKVLPTIIFFGGFMGVLYYLGIMQRVIEALARFMRWTIGTSGSETLSCSANIFVGQTEAPLLIKPFLEGLTRSELLTVMVGGFATIAGGVLAGYIAMGIPAAHLIAASVMGAPAALVMGKILFPERESSQTAGDVKVPDIPVGSNAVEAATNGISDGFKLALNVGAMLVGFIALIAVVDVFLNWGDALVDGKLLGGAWAAYGTAGLSPAVGEYQGVFPGSLRTLFGTLLRPLAFVMGVPWADAGAVGNLLGIKLSLNEFVAYGELASYIQGGAIGDRAEIIATYALCGFANFSSVGIQIGGISAIAPSRKADLARVGIKAMLGGALATCMNATIAGILL